MNKGGRPYCLVVYKSGKEISQDEQLHQDCALPDNATIEEPKKAFLTITKLRNKGRRWAAFLLPMGLRFYLCGHAVFPDHRAAEVSQHLVELVQHNRLSHALIVSRP